MESFSYSPWEYWNKGALLIWRAAGGTPPTPQWGNLLLFTNMIRFPVSIGFKSLNKSQHTLLILRMTANPLPSSCESTPLILASEMGLMGLCRCTCRRPFISVFFYLGFFVFSGLLAGLLPSLLSRMHVEKSLHFWSLTYNWKMAFSE